MLSCEATSRRAWTYSHVISFFFRLSVPQRDTPKPAHNETRQTHSQGFGFSRLACRERSERNAKREKTYIIFSGGTDEKILNPFPKEIPLILFCRRNGCKKSLNPFPKEIPLILFCRRNGCKKSLNPFPKEIPLVPYFINLIKKKWQTIRESSKNWPS